MEVWKDIQGYEKVYQVSNLGRVKSLERYIIKNNNIKFYVRERILKQSKTGPDYWYVRLSYKGIVFKKSVHRLVAITFIPNPLNKRCVNHIDSNHLNNNVSNLEWNTYKENSIHAAKHAYLIKNYNVTKIINEYNSGLSLIDVGVLNNLSNSTIQRVLNIENVLIRKSSQPKKRYYLILNLLNNKMSTKEISLKLNITSGNVRSYKFRMKQRGELV